MPLHEVVAIGTESVQIEMPDRATHEHMRISRVKVVSQVVKRDVRRFTDDIIDARKYSTLLRGFQPMQHAHHCGRGWANEASARSNSELG